MKIFICFLSFLFIYHFVSGDTTCSNRLKIYDNEKLSHHLESVRELFLSKRPVPFDRLDMTVLLPNDDGSWTRGGVEQNRLTYPASTVKLPYLVSGVHWCMTQNRSYNCLDDHNRPMIYTSDNFETGVVVDFVTGAPNYITNQNDSTFQKWVAMRNFTSRFLDSRGLLENQITIHKTYPSNTGDPSGAEQLSINIYGRNMMNPKCASSLLAEIVSGELLPEARDYLLGLLFHTRHSFTSLGPGLPPGTILYTKGGNAYDNLNEIAYVRLPNGKRFIVSVYTNGYDPNGSYTYTLSWLSELIVDRLGLCVGCPPKYILDIQDKGFMKVGSWQVSTVRDAFRNQYLQSSDPNSKAGWEFTVNDTSLYEVSFWNPQNKIFCKSSTITISHRYGTSTVTKDQSINGGVWTRLGDFYFDQHKNYKIEISKGKNCEGKSISVDALKIIKWPNCGKIPGTSCLPDKL